MFSLTSKQLSRAAAIQEKIEELRQEMEAIFGGSDTPRPNGSESAEVKPGRRRGKLSVAGRARIVAAQKARWARARGKAGK